MIAILDSGPLMYLAAANQFELLRVYFSRALIPLPVYHEVVQSGTAQPGSGETEAAVRDGWLVIEELRDTGRMASLLEQNMTRTDAYLLALALERQVDQVISDDMKVRTLAINFGFQVFGTLGVLIEGKRDGHISNLKAILDQLIRAGFYLNPESSLYRDVLRLAGE